MQSNFLLGHLTNPLSHTNYWTLFGTDYHALPLLLISTLCPYYGLTSLFSIFNLLYLKNRDIIQVYTL
jgi:hypothetical protein